MLTGQLLAALAQMWPQQRPRSRTTENGDRFPALLPQKIKLSWQTKCSLAIDCSYNASNYHIKDNLNTTVAKADALLLENEDFGCGQNYAMLIMPRKKYKTHDYNNIFDYNIWYTPDESLDSIYLEASTQLKTSASIYKPKHQAILSMVWRPFCFVCWHRLFVNSNAIYDASPHTKYIYHGIMHRKIQPSGCLAATVRAC